MPSNLNIVGRLNDGLSLEMARSLVESGNLPYQVRLYAGGASRVDVANIRLLFGAVMVLLVIACTNIAGLFAARGLVKAREITVHSALGATRARLVRQMLCEPLLLALTGGTIGVFISILGIKIFYALRPIGGTGILEASMNVPTLLFAGVITIGSVLFFGLIPAFRNSKVNLMDALKATGSENSRRKVIRARSVLVIVEIALAVMLLAGAGVIVKSFQNRMNVDLGVRWDANLMTVYVAPDREVVYERSRSVFVDEMLAQLKQHPAISSVAAASRFTFGLGSLQMSVRTMGGSGDWFQVQANFVTSGFFEVAGVPLIRGRTFSDKDINVEQAVIVSESFARKLWPEEEAIGKFVILGVNAFEVVGVCGEVRYQTLAREPEPTLYLPLTTSAPMRDKVFLVRTERNPRDVIPFVRQTLGTIAPDLPIDRIHTNRDMLNDPGIASARFYMSFFLFFAFLALVIAVLGIYGLVHYVVTQQRRDIGIRIAIGATSKDILIMMLGRWMILAVIGIVLGLVLFIAFNRIITSYLYGVSPTDVPTLIVISVLALIVAATAILIPSIKAMRTNPIILLKRE
jgi:predicted permease